MWHYCCWGKSLSVAVASYDTIRELWLKDNPIGVEGALLMVEAVVHNTSYLYVSIDGKYKSNRVKEMLFILEKRRRQEVAIVLADYIVSTWCNKFNVVMVPED